MVHACLLHPCRMKRPSRSTESHLAPACLWEILRQASQNAYALQKHMSFVCFAGRSLQCVCGIALAQMGTQRSARTSR